MNGYYSRLEAEARKEAERKTRPKVVREYRLEDDEQRDVCRWLDGNRLRYFHPPNGGSRNRIEAARLSHRGVKPGVPDLWVLTPPPKRPSAKGVVVEMKSTRPGAKTTPEQLEWLEELARLGFVTAVCHGADDAIAFFQSLGYGQEVT